jgi:hypothetical protein
MALGGCATVVSSAASSFAGNLGKAIFNQPDPDVVRDGAPAYLLLLDSFVEGNPDNPDLLAASAQLYAAYGAVFADEPLRAKILTSRALQYSERAVCLDYRRACDWPTQTYQEFEATLDGIDEDQATTVEAYAVSSLAYIRAHSDDWNALTRLPHIEALLLKLTDYRDGAGLGSLYGFLGILNTLRPPALGGEPEKGREYFERAIELTGGRDLSLKVEYARGYARLVYEQELHDALLQDVLLADPVADGYTLTNTLAQRDAAELLQSGKDYF